MAYHGRLVFTARLQYAKRRVYYPQYIGRTPVFEKEFGVRPTTAINFDSFGHSVGLVQILNQAGYDTYVVCRPAKAQFPFREQDYLWKGLAGSEVLVHRSDENYNSVYGHVGKELEQFLEDTKDEPVSLYLWGVGDHGGGPSRVDLTDVTKLIKERAEELEIIHSIRRLTLKREKRRKPPIRLWKRA